MHQPGRRRASDRRGADHVAMDAVGAIRPPPAKRTLDLTKTRKAVTGDFGGGSSLDPADPQDGILDLAVVPAGRRIGLARRALGMRTGGLTEQRDVTHARGCEIELHLRNTSPDAITLAQVNINDAIWPYTVSPSATMSRKNGQI